MILVSSVENITSSKTNKIANNISQIIRFNAIKHKRRGSRGTVVKGIERISTIVLVNIWVARVQVPLCQSGFEFAKTQLSILNH